MNANKKNVFKNAWMFEILHETTEASKETLVFWECILKVFKGHIW